MGYTGCRRGWSGLGSLISTIGYNSAKKNEMITLVEKVARVCSMEIESIKSQ